MTEDSEVDTVKVSDLRKKFEGGKWKESSSGRAHGDANTNNVHLREQPTSAQLPRPPAKPPHISFACEPGPSWSSGSPPLPPHRARKVAEPARKKPPLAPKPTHLLSDYKPATSAQPVETDTPTEQAESLVRERAKLIADQLYAQAEKRHSQRASAVAESGGPISPPRIALLPTMYEGDEKEGGEVVIEVEEEELDRRSQVEKTLPMDTDDDDCADSELDSEESRSTIDTISREGFPRFSQRYASSTSGYGSSDLHSAIMKDLLSKGITASGLSQSIQMRSKSTRQQTRSVSGSALQATSPKSDGGLLYSSSINSVVESGSSSGFLVVNGLSTPIPAQERGNGRVPDYASGDELEDVRLKKLHYAAMEFRTVQNAIVEYLHMIVNVYPSYLAEYGERTGRSILMSGSGSSTAHMEGGIHVVQRVQKLLLPCHEFHKVLLNDICNVMDDWNSQTPRMSQIFDKTAPFLKVCVPFLKEKSKIADELTRLTKEDADFAEATLSFEQRVFKRGVGAVIQQLDQVHQNFMRYKLLMQSYMKFLPEDSEERSRTESVIGMLEKINREVNQSMGLPTSEQLMRLATLFQGQFDVFKPGRRLIRQENVDKQTRKENQARILVLFSDTLWLCRETSSLASDGMFDMDRSYSIPIEEVRLEIDNHFDYDCYMAVRSKRKSAGLWFKCASAREEWRMLIENAKVEMAALKERLNMARRKSSKALMRVSMESSAAVDVLVRQTSGMGESAAGAAIATRPAPPPPAVRPHSEVLSEKGHTSSNGRMSEESDEEADYAQSELDEDEAVGCAQGLAGATGDEGPHQDYTENGNHDKQPPSLETVERALWINDRMSTKCMMMGCGDVFNLVSRRHHCRNCGYIICKRCRGYAPVKELNFERAIVCPECYEKIEAAYRAGTLFPAIFLEQDERGVHWLRVTKGRKGKERIARVNPKELFALPRNKGLRRQKIDDMMRRGKVFLKTKRGESQMHANLADDGMLLAFYKAAYDKLPHDQHVIYGFTLEEENIVSESGRVVQGKRFTLRHKNQFGDDGHRVISFRVESDTAAKMWSASLNRALNRDEQSDVE